MLSVTSALSYCKPDPGIKFILLYHDVCYKWLPWCFFPCILLYVYYLYNFVISSLSFSLLLVWSRCYLFHLAPYYFGSCAVPSPSCFPFNLLLKIYIYLLLYFLVHFCFFCAPPTPMRPLEDFYFLHLPTFSTFQYCWDNALNSRVLLSFLLQYVYNFWGIHIYYIYYNSSVYLIIIHLY